MNLEGIVSKRADAPYRSGRGDDWTKAKCRAGHEVVIGGWSHHGGQIPLPAGGRASRRSSDLCRPGRHRLFRRQGEAAAAAAEGDGGARHRPSPARTRPSTKRGVHLAEAGTGGGNRIRRLDRRRHGAPGCLQGPARRQAGRRSGGRDAEENQEAGRSRKAARRSAAKRSGGDEHSHLPSRQGAVAGCRRRQAGHQAGTGALLRSGGRLDAAAYQGPALLHRARARRHRGRAAFLPAPCHGRASPACSAR